MKFAPKIGQKDEKANRLTQSIEDLRIRMFAFVDELLPKEEPVMSETPFTHRETQLKFESFKVETASRKVLQELLDYFTSRDVENERIIREVRF